MAPARTGLAASGFRTRSGTMDRMDARCPDTGWLTVWTGENASGVPFPSAALRG